MFFDNLVVQHYAGPLVEENQYYPFGLVQKGISSKAFGRLENKVKYNGYEENKTFDINWYESFYRTNDTQLGRFWQLDPKPTDFESLYVAMGNNPIRNNDPLGDTLPEDHNNYMMDYQPVSNAGSVGQGIVNFIGNLGVFTYNSTMGVFASSAQGMANVTARTVNGTNDNQGSIMASVE